MPMEFFYTTELAVPMSQMVLLLICTTVALLFGRIKLALLVNYLFALFWGYVLNRDVLIGFGESVKTGCSKGAGRTAERACVLFPICASLLGSSNPLKRR